MRSALPFTFVVAFQGLLHPDASAGEKTGLEIGAKAPAFTLKDQAGKEHAERGDVAWLAQKGKVYAAVGNA